jgi:hypothetical protein
VNFPFVNPTAEDIHAIEIARCKFDCEYFIEEYVKIEDRDTEGIVIPFHLWQRQKEVLENFLFKRLIQVLKANQLGLTWLIISYATWGLYYNSGYLVLGISETETKAKEIIRRIDFILRHLPSWMISDKNNLVTPWFETTTLKIVIHHQPKDGEPQEDSVIQTFASSPTAGASFTANLFLFDEWALQEYAREIWTYAFPTINRPTGGQVIGISTIERGSLFEDIWHAKNSFCKIFLGWFSDPRRDQKWYDNTLIELGKDETLKHYPATEEEAFAIPGGAYFKEFNSMIHLREPLIAIPQWYSKYRFLDYGMDMLACYFVYMDGYGYARIYKEIYKPGLVISEAAYEILKESGADIPDSSEKWNGLTKERKRQIASTAKEKVLCTFAPPDLFAKSNQTGKSSDEVWYENGVPLTKTKNDFEQGCSAVAQWLQPFLIKNEQTGEYYYNARLTIDKDAAPNLVRAFLNIQKDKHRTAVYSKTPHELTHSVDACRGFCTEITTVPINEEEEKLKRQRELYETAYPQDLMEDEIISDPDLIM